MRKILEVLPTICLFIYFNFSPELCFFFGEKLHPFTTHRDFLFSTLFGLLGGPCSLRLVATTPTGGGISLGKQLPQNVPETIPPFSLPPHRFSPLPVADCRLVVP